jgi:hypothetical protein
VYLPVRWTGTSASDSAWAVQVQDALPGMI